MKAVNAGYTINVSFIEGNSSFRGIDELTGTAFIGSNNQRFCDTNGNERESTLSQRFVHEVLGEGVTAGNTGDMRTYQNLIGETDPNSVRTLHKGDLQVIQTENIYNAQFGFLRTGGDRGSPGYHGLNAQDISKIGIIPSNFSSSFLIEGDWIWKSK